MKIAAVVRKNLGAMTACLLFFLLCSGSAIARDDDDSEGGRVYSMSNLAAGNTVVVFQRAHDGALTQIQEVSTGGLGSGVGVLPPPLPTLPGPDPLNSQDALTITADGRFLLAVNPGSNELSALAIDDDGVTLTDKVSSGGTFPVSVAVHGDIVYVVNEGESPNTIIGKTANISGFRLDVSGKLHAIPNSTQVLGVDTGTSDIVFSPTGKQLLVTEMFTSIIDVFQVLPGGLTGNRVQVPSNAPTPFGAAFSPDGLLSVSEIDEFTVMGRREGVPNASTVSTYRVVNGALQIISKSVATNRTGSCWQRFSKDGRFVFTSDTGAGTVSTLNVSPQGTLTLAGIVSTGGAFSGPVDMDITPDGRFLYLGTANALLSHTPPIFMPLPATGTGRIQGYRIENDGSLTPINTVGGLPLSMQGLVAR